MRIGQRAVRRHYGVAGWNGSRDLCGDPGSRCLRQGLGRDPRGGGYGVAPSIRVTLQRANYRQLPIFVDLARAVGARQVSFLAVDVANPHAFGRIDDFSSDLALRVEDLPVFEELVRSMEVQHAESFRSGFIAESPSKLRRILQYFSAVCGREAFPPVRCNAPEFSAVIAANGRVQPCFFIPGPPDADAWRDFGAALDGDGMAALREEIRAGKRPECSTCVCSMWRELDVAPRAGPYRAPGSPGLMAGKRLKVVLYNPQAVFYTMPLALLAIGSELDPDLYEVVIVDARLDSDAESTVLSHIGEAVCLGVTVLTGAPISDALPSRARRSGPGRT